MPAWHQLGNVVPGGTSDVEDVLKLGGIDFDVTRRPVEFRNNLDGPNRVLAETFVTVRQDTGAGLGVVGSKYEVLQNRDAFTFLQDLVDRHDVIWESAGAVRDGRRVFICMRLPKTVTIDTAGVADQIIPFIVALNSHDGSSLFHVVVTPWRPVCRNTERFALRDAVTRWGVRHTRNARDRIEEARRTLGLSATYFDRFAAEEEALARTDLVLAKYRRVIDDLWQPPADDASTRTKNSHRRRTDERVNLYTTNAAQLGNTAYAAERALTEYADWKQVLRPTGSLRGNNLAARATAVPEGSNDDLKSRAHRRLLTLVRREGETCERLQSPGRYGRAPALDLPTTTILANRPTQVVRKRAGAHPLRTPDQHPGGRGPAPWPMRDRGRKRRPRRPRCARTEHRRLQRRLRAGLGQRGP
ncbi:DUF932 domain-containing protein [Rugosimonospora africana]|uniref:DUF932 domain-containing protein n=1 Tax=Rugosimonospora africana TaxID=556532 RepID=UPI0023B2C18F|nr:DUF932 domain-containing protein [Rugosimonospora africana]